MNSDLKISSLLILFLYLLSFEFYSNVYCTPIPFLKKITLSGGSLKLKNVLLKTDANIAENEKQFLLQLFKIHQIKIDPSGLPLYLSIQSISLPEIKSLYRSEIEQQAYQILINTDGIKISGNSPPAIFYALQTFEQLIDNQRNLPFAEITDYPDVPIRMIMLDPARQNENFDYYKKVIQFAANYKINAILLHLTDDQTSCLFHNDFPRLMHPQAWTTGQIKELTAFAKKYYIEVIPEIESFGHSRMFTRMPDYPDYLHQTDLKQSRLGWTGTEIAGYTNVLCPASEKALSYLDKMYEKARLGFDFPWLHIGFDEVDISNCRRCKNTYGEISAADWILKHLKKCRDMVLNKKKKMALWGDMLLKYPQVLEKLPTDSTIIFDWHYRPQVSDVSVQLFKQKGFEIIASPALVCYPHMILPDRHNFQNISRFTQIARENDLLGVNTTIWIPTRYMSDVLWTGIAYAATHAWSGSNWNESGFYQQFFKHYFGSERGEDFQKMWKKLAGIILHRDEFNIGCWMDEKSLEKAKELLANRKKEFEQNIMTLTEVEEKLQMLSACISKNFASWQAIERSANLLKYSINHLLAAENVQTDGKWNNYLIEEMDKDVKVAIQWIKEDWDKNRYPDDPNKNGLFLDKQHLLFRFKQMHEFHQKILGEN